MVPSVWGCICDLLLLLALGASPAMGRNLPRPLEDSELHLTPEAHSKGPDVFWGSPWGPTLPQAPAADSPPGPALHRPRAAPGAAREQLPGPDNLQVAWGPGFQGWMGPPSAWEPLEQETLAPAPMGAPSPPFSPTIPQPPPRAATIPPSPWEPGSQAPRPPPVNAEARDPAQTLGAPSGTARGPVLGDQGGQEEDLQELAQGPLTSQQHPAAPDTGPASTVELGSPREPGIQVDLAPARSLPPAEQLPAETPKEAGAGETRPVSSPGPPPDATASSGPPPTGPAASAAPSGQPKPGECHRESGLSRARKRAMV